MTKEEKTGEAPYPRDFIEAMKLACALNWSPERDKTVREIFGLSDDIEDQGGK
jgi:hypothetical protein